MSLETKKNRDEIVKNAHNVLIEVIEDSELGALLSVKSEINHVEQLAF